MQLSVVVSTNNIKGLVTIICRYYRQLGHFEPANKNTCNQMRLDTFPAHVTMHYSPITFPCRWLKAETKATITLFPQLWMLYLLPNHSTERSKFSLSLPVF